MTQHNIDPEDYLQDVHDVDYSNLMVCTHLQAVLAQLSGKKLIYTNGTFEHAQRVLEKRKIAHLFPDIHDIRAAQLVSKPSKEAFQKFLLKYNIEPTRAIFFDDSPANTKVAKTLGIYSVLVYEGKMATPYDHSDTHCNETIYSLSDYLNHIMHLPKLVDFDCKIYGSTGL
jgi:putative hydrolase of the HAD superfamily